MFQRYVTSQLKVAPSDVAGMSKLRGHIQCACNTHPLGELGHAPAVKIFIHSEIASEAIFGHKHHSFSLICILASRPHKSNRTCQ